MISNLINILQCPKCRNDLLFKKSKNINFDGTFYCKNKHNFFLKDSVIDFISYENNRIKIYNEI